MRSPDLDLNGVNFRHPFRHAMHFRADVGYAYKNDTRYIERFKRYEESELQHAITRGSIWENRKCRYR